MSENGALDLRLATMEDLVKELAFWQERGISLRHLVEQFFLREEDFSMSLSDVKDDSKLALLSESVRAMVKQISAHPAAILAFYGPNNAGKSTLLNCLLGCSFMAVGSGYVTARICAVGWAKLEDAEIILTTLDGLNTGVYTGCTKSSIARWTSENVAAQLKLWLERPAKDEDLESWTNTVVFVKYPFELLESGLILVDLPGKSDSDSAAIQTLLARYFTSVRPAGVCFVYNNPSWTTDAKSSYDFLQVALEKTKDANVDPEIFFISTQFNLQSVWSDKDWHYTPGYHHSALDDVVRHQWQLLKAQGRISAESYETDLNFAVANSLDYSKLQNGVLEEYEEYEGEENPSHKVALLFAEFRKRLFTFSVLTQRVRYETIYKRLLDGSAQFFRIYLTHKSKNRKAVLEQVQYAKEETIKLETQLLNSATTAINLLTTIIPNLCAQPSTWEAIWTEANNASERFDGKIKATEQDALIKCISNAIAPIVQTLVIAPMLDRLEKHLNCHLEKVIQDRMELISHNQIFGAALRGAIVVDSIQFYTAGAAGNILNRFIRTLQNVRRGTVVLTILASPVIATVAFCAAVSSFFLQTKDKILGAKIDKAFRIQVTKRLLDDMSTAIGIKELKTNAGADIKNLISNVVQNIDDQAKIIEHALDLLQKSDKTLKSLRQHFASYECECWVELRQLEGSLAPLEPLDPLKPLLSSSDASTQDPSSRSSSSPNINTATPSMPSSTGISSPSPLSSPSLSPLPSHLPNPLLTTFLSQKNASTERFRLEYARWKGMRVLVKSTPKAHAAGDMLLNFLEDAHYSLHLRRLAAESSMMPSILPALAIHRTVDSDGHKEYSLIYDDCEGDLERLFAEDSRMMMSEGVERTNTLDPPLSGVPSPSSPASPPPSLSSMPFEPLEGLSRDLESTVGVQTPYKISDLDRFYFCLQAAMGVASLHDCDITHGNIRPKSLWYQTSGEYYMAYLTDFSAATTSNLGSDAMGISNGSNNDWVPPEALSAVIQQREAASAELHARTASSGSVGSVGSGSSTSTPTSSGGRSRGRKATEAKARASAAFSGKPCDIWMLGKTMLFFLTSNAVHLKVPSQWSLIADMMGDEPQMRPTAGVVVKRLKVLIRDYCLHHHLSTPESPLYELIFGNLPQVSPIDTPTTTQEHPKKLVTRQSFYNTSPGTLVPSSAINRAASRKLLANIASPSLHPSPELLQEASVTPSSNSLATSTQSFPFRRNMVPSSSGTNMTAHAESTRTLLASSSTPHVSSSTLPPPPSRTSSQLPIRPD